ncbi:MAG: haloacid dehalogenase type II [Terriglobales bacterium]
MAFDFSHFSWLTFDCYGTLIDWESGIVGAIRPLFAAAGRTISADGILELYAALEAREEAGPYRPYREILESVTRRMAARLVVSLNDRQAMVLADTIGTWPPFPDSVDALRRLKTRFKLAVISNVDDDLFAATSNLLGDPFDAIITAQQARSYKPSENNFRLALERIGEPVERVLHCAQSLYHDIAPARHLGFSTVWVDRRAGSHGQGATPNITVEPDLRVTTMAELATAAGV